MSVNIHMIQSITVNKSTNYGGGTNIPVLSENGGSTFSERKQQYFNP